MRGQSLKNVPELESEDNKRDGKRAHLAAENKSCHAKHDGRQYEEVYDCLETALVWPPPQHQDNIQPWVGWRRSGIKNQKNLNPDLWQISTVKAIAAEAIDKMPYHPTRQFGYQMGSPQFKCTTNLPARHQQPTNASTNYTTPFLDAS